MPKIRQIFNNFIENLENYLINEEKDNNCYLVFDCSFEEIITGISPTLQSRIIAAEYTKEKDS